MEIKVTYFKKMKTTMNMRFLILSLLASLNYSHSQSKLYQFVLLVGLDSLQTIK